MWVRLSGDRRGDHHDREKSEPRQLQNPIDPARENLIPTPTSHRIHLSDFIPKETRDRLRELVQKSPNPQKSLNYFRTRFAPFLPGIGKSDNFPDSTRGIPSPFNATPGNEDIAPCVDGVASPPCSSQDDGCCGPEKSIIGTGEAAGGLILPPGASTMKTTTVEATDAMESLLVLPQTVVQEAILYLRAVPNMAAMKVFSLACDVDTKGEVESIRVGTTEVLQHRHIFATPEMPCHRRRRSFRDKAEPSGCMSHHCEAFHSSLWSYSS
jgi:hypothetical protein